MKTVNTIFKYFVLIMFSLVTLIPFFWVGITSLKSIKDLTNNGPLAMPIKYEFANYITAWQDGNFAVYYRNSIIVSFFTVIGVILLSLLAAYAFAFFKFKFKNTVFAFVILGLMVPVELLIIPLYNTMTKLNLLNTLACVILPQIALTVPFGIFILRSFMKDIPYALLESARLDGFKEIQILRYIIVPLLKPAIISLFIFSLIWSWNNFMLPTIFLQDDNLRTVPAGLSHFQGRFNVNYPLVAAGSNIIALPLIVIYLVLQKKFIRGMMVGALKE